MAVAVVVAHEVVASFEAEGQFDSIHHLVGVEIAGCEQIYYFPEITHNKPNYGLLFYYYFWLLSFF